MMKTYEKISKFSGEIKIDESYFLKKHFCFTKSTTLVLKLKEFGRGASGKTPECLKRWLCLHTNS